MHHIYCLHLKCSLLAYNTLNSQFTYIITYLKVYKITDNTGFIGNLKVIICFSSHFVVAVQ